MVRRSSSSRRLVVVGAVAALLGVTPLVAASGAGSEPYGAYAVGKDESPGIGDGGPAVDAALEGPRMVALDGHGGYYIADTYHHRIRHVEPGGTIETVAGAGHAGFRDGPADQALFDSPHSVDVDDAGMVFVGDPVNNRVRMINPRTGMVTTVAGTGQRRYSGDGGPALDAGLNDSKVALVGPDGNVYVADYGNSVVRRIRLDRNPPTIETFAGSGDDGPLCFCDGKPARQAFFKPRNIAFDIDGDLIVADRESNTIRSIAFKGDGTAGVITTIAGLPGTTGFSGDGGPATGATLFEPRGLGVDWMGNVYIADSSNNRIRRIDTDGIIDTVVGTGKSGRSGDGVAPEEMDLSNPRHVVFDPSGRMYITDTGGNRIMTVTNLIPPNPTPPPPPVEPSEHTPAEDKPAGQKPVEPTPDRPRAAPPTESARAGYWMLGAEGAVYAFGDARRHGDHPGFDAGFDAVDLEDTPSGAGYWIADSGGTVSAHGDALALGGVAALLTGGERVTSLSATPTGRGYWAFTNRGRALPKGDAAFLGDMAAVALNGPVLDSIPTPSGKGYYMVASDGGIFAFGDAVFHGSMGAVPLNAPVQSLVPDPDRTGYWLVASDGGVFAFDARFRGSMGATPLARPMTGMVPYGDGYLMVAEDGGAFNFSNRPFSGSLGATPPLHPILAVAAL